MRYAELFTGCGGLSLGLEQAGWRPAWFCEVDKHCRAVLAARWPDVPIVVDVRDVGRDAAAADATNDGSVRSAAGGMDDAVAGRRPLDDAATAYADIARLEGAQPEGRQDMSARGARLDLLAGGFPCPDFSFAGRRAGMGGERNLWPEFARCVRLFRPRRVLVENVPGLATAVGARAGESALGTVVADLAEAGYVGSWFRLRASDVGAPHRRERLFVVAADAGGDGRERSPEPHIGPLEPGQRPSRRGDVDGRAAASADAGSLRRGRRPHRKERADVSNAAPTGRQQSEPSAENSAGVAWSVYEPAIRRWEHLTRPAPRPTDARGRLEPEFTAWMLGFPQGWTGVDGVSRTAQLRMLGNAVQVQCGQLIGAQLLADAAAPTAKETG